VGENALEIPSVLLVDQDQVEVVARAELFVDVAEGGSELEPAEEESDRYCLACRCRRGVSFACAHGLGGKAKADLEREHRP
jgi:hypothetical protein